MNCAYCALVSGYLAIANAGTSNFVPFIFTYPPCCSFTVPAGISIHANGGGRRSRTLDLVSFDGVMGKETAASVSNGAIPFGS